MSVPVNYSGSISEQALATAQWGKPADIAALAYKPGALWLGRAADMSETAIGLSDDRHALIVAGSRSGKGTSTIIPNLCLWPGSLVVIDPKGENASIAAARRGGGSEYCDGLDQRTFVLDPFKAATLPDEFRASYNPLDALDGDHEEAVDDAGRIADALVVSPPGSSDPFWDEQARTLIKALILHVITSDNFNNRRNLIAVRQLITSGDTATRKILEEMGEKDIPSPFELLFEGMRRNETFNGIVSGVGETFSNLATSSPKTLSGILSAAGNHTEFIDSLPMQRLLQSTTPGIKLAALKTDPMGVSIFLSLPQRFMNTHFRWLRMMVSLIVTEMERVPGKPATGHPVLLLLDEFAGLKKMEVVEHAAAQIAGFGVKMCFIVQGFTQLKSVYGENWEIFVSNAGTKLFFGIDDNFTRDYISKQLGETEVVRTTRNQSKTTGTSQSYTTGSSSSTSNSTSSTSGGSSGTSYSTGSGRNSDIGLFWDTARTSSSNSSISYNSGSSWSSSSSSSSSYSTNRSSTDGTSESRTDGTSQSIHKRPLLTPDEIGLIFSRVEEETNAAYPGLALAVTSGRRPIIVRRVNYFNDRSFVRTFDPHPDHGFKPISNHVIPVIAPPVVEEDSKDIVDQLISFYGIKNFEKSISAYKNLQYAYPDCPFAKKTQIAFVKEALDFARWNAEFCAKYGENRTIEEFTDYISDHKSLKKISELKNFDFIFTKSDKVSRTFEILRKIKNGKNLTFIEQIKAPSLIGKGAIVTYLVTPFLVGSMVALFATVFGAIGSTPEKKIFLIRVSYFILLIPAYQGLRRYHGKELKIVTIVTFVILLMISSGLVGSSIDKLQP